MLYTGKKIARKLACIFLLIPGTFLAQEAGDFNWKHWNVVIPIADNSGKSSVIEGKTIRKYKLTDQQKQFVKKNSNNTFSLTTNFTGVTESGTFDILNGKNSNSELVEVYTDKSGDKHWITSEGSHVLKTRMKVQKSNGMNNVVHMCRILSDENKDLASIVWRGGTLYALMFNPEKKTGRKVKKIKIGQVDLKMFDLVVNVSNNTLTTSIKCKEAGIDKSNMMVGRFQETNNALFRLGSYFKNNDNYEDKVTIQLKYAMVEHSKK